MKTLIFLFLGFFCITNAQTDSLRIAEKLNRLQQTNFETIKLIKKLDKVEAENKNLIYQIKMYIKKLTTKNQVEIKEFPQAIKPENINEPIAEVEIPAGTDTIRGSFFYRIFHKQKYYLKPYKIINDEKIYLP